MIDEAKIQLIARAARVYSAPAATGDPETPISILSLAAASYGARPADDATVPTGFDPLAVALFEAIVEGAYLVASADGVVDDEERRTFERLVTTACGGAVTPSAITALVADLADQLSEDGLDRRVQAVAGQIHKKEHAREVLRVAALLAHASQNVSDVERAVLGKLAAACNLEASEVDKAVADVKRVLAGAGAS